MFGIFLENMVIIIFILTIVLTSLEIIISLWFLFRKQMRVYFIISSGSFLNLIIVSIIIWSLLTQFSEDIINGSMLGLMITNVVVVALTVEILIRQEVRTFHIFILSVVFLTIFYFFVGNAFNLVMILIYLGYLTFFIGLSCHLCLKSPSHLKKYAQFLLISSACFSLTLPLLLYFMNLIFITQITAFFFLISIIILILVLLTVLLLFLLVSKPEVVKGLHITLRENPISRFEKKYGLLIFLNLVGLFKFLLNAFRLFGFIPQEHGSQIPIYSIGTVLFVSLGIIEMISIAFLARSKKRGITLTILPCSIYGLLGLMGGFFFTFYPHEVCPEGLEGFLLFFQFLFFYDYSYVLFTDFLNAFGLMGRDQINYTGVAFMCFLHFSISLVILLFLLKWRKSSEIND